jgi:hypoxanthine phosphoribosyltransferase
MAEPRPSEVLIPADVIARRVGELAADIRRDVPGELHLVAVLKGAFVFLADLIREIGGAVTVDFIAISSYGVGTETSGQVRLVQDLEAAIDGRDVIIVEDIVDTGLTLAYLQTILAARQPKTLRTVCLLNKPSRRQADVRVDYVGFAIDDCFVVGYGLDYGGQYRNLPHIAVLDHAGPPDDSIAARS